MGGENAQRFGLEQQTCAQQLQSNNPEHVRRTIDRLLMCCNTTMASRTQVAPQVVEQNMVTQPAAEPVAEEPSRKRKAEMFEPTDDDAASVLRAALHNFSA